MSGVRILLITHSAVLPTGMAEVVRLIFGGLLDKFPGKYCIQQLGLMHVSAVTPSPWPITPTETKVLSDGRVIMNPQDEYGQQTLPKVFENFKPDIIFAHNDPQNVVFLVEAAKTLNCRLVLYVNFDGIPVPPGYEVLIGADRLVVMSRFSKKAFLSRTGNDPPVDVEVMYSPADLDRFRPLADDERAQLRQLNLPTWMPANAFVIGLVGRNQWRKQIWSAYEILSLLRTGGYLICKECGDVILNRTGQHRSKCSACKYVEAQPLMNVFLWVHIPTGKELGAWPLEEIEALYGVKPGRELYYTEGCSRTEHLPPEDMPCLYQIWDLMLFLSGGEGFGLPAWEAMCSELPIVYTDYSSHAEFIGDAGAGLAIGGTLQPEPGTVILRMIPRVEAAVAAVRRLYFDGELRSEIGRRGRVFAAAFCRERMAVKWDQIFCECLDPRSRQANVEIASCRGA